MTDQDHTSAARREFMLKCGRLALTAPPAMAVLMSTTQRSYAAAGTHVRTHTSHSGHADGSNPGVGSHNNNAPTTNPGGGGIQNPNKKPK